MVWADTCWNWMGEGRRAALWCLGILLCLLSPIEKKAGWSCTPPLLLRLLHTFGGCLAWQHAVTVGGHVFGSKCFVIVVVVGSLLSRRKLSSVKHYASDALTPPPTCTHLLREKDHGL